MKIVENRAILKTHVLMEPKWNVKSEHAETAVIRLSINGTKVECKGVCSSKRYSSFTVLMEPKWNVKEAETRGRSRGH